MFFAIATWWYTHLGTNSASPYSLPFFIILSPSHDCCIIYEYSPKSMHTFTINNEQKPCSTTQTHFCWPMRHPIVALLFDIHTQRYNTTDANALMLWCSDALQQKQKQQKKILTLALSFVLRVHIQIQFIAKQFWHIWRVRQRRKDKRNYIAVVFGERNS